MNFINDKRISGEGRVEAVLLLILLLLLASIGFSNTILPADSAKKYPLNDPRNPHCPCHQYQKLADDEYAKLQGKQQNVVYPPNGELKVSDRISGKNSSSKNYFWFYHKKRKCAGRKNKSGGHYSMKRKVSDRLSRCFHF